MRTNTINTKDLALNKVTLKKGKKVLHILRDVMTNKRVSVAVM